MAILKTDYVDDVLDLTQNSQRKFEEIENQDGSKSFRDVTVYEREGDNYGANDLNATNEQVNTNTNALTVGEDGELIRFAVDSDGNYGYKKVGADTFYPFKHPEGDITISANGNYDVELKKNAIVNVDMPAGNVNIQFGGASGTGTTNYSNYVNYTFEKGKQYVLTIVCGASTDGQSKAWSCNISSTNTNGWTVVSNADRTISRGYSREYIAIIKPTYTYSCTVTCSGTAYLNYADVHTRFMLVTMPY